MRADNIAASRVRAAVHISRIIGRVIGLGSVAYVKSRYACAQRLIGHASRRSGAERGRPRIRPAGSAPGRKRPNRAAGKPERQAPAAHTQSGRPARSGSAVQREPAERRHRTPGRQVPGPEHRGMPSARTAAGRKHPAPRPSRPSSDCRTQARCRQSGPAPR